MGRRKRLLREKRAAKKEAMYKECMKHRRHAHLKKVQKMISQFTEILEKMI